jgi:pyruvate,water dikinase
MTNAAIKFFEVAYQEAGDVKTIEGTPASPGVAEGRAVVITRLEGLHKIRTDSILVCPNMSPEMTIVFSELKGVVTDHGGALANVSIVAREWGIPAVVGTLMATKSIQNGDLIRIDGAAGRVEIVLKAYRREITRVTEIWRAPTAGGT